MNSIPGEDFNPEPKRKETLKSLRSVNADLSVIPYLCTCLSSQPPVLQRKGDGKDMLSGDRL